MINICHSGRCVLYYLILAIGRGTHPSLWYSCTGHVLLTHQVSMYRQVWRRYYDLEVHLPWTLQRQDLHPRLLLQALHWSVEPPPPQKKTLQVYWYWDEKCPAFEFCLCNWNSNSSSKGEEWCIVKKMVPHIISLIGILCIQSILPQQKTEAKQCITPMLRYGLAISKLSI